MPDAADSNPRPDTHEDTDTRAQSDPDFTSGSSAILHVGDELRLGLNPDTYHHAIDIISDGQLWYRLHFRAGDTPWRYPIERIDYVGGRGQQPVEPGQQSGSGHQPPDHDLRQPAGGPTNDPDPRGTTAGVSLERGAGEPGAVPDADARGPYYARPTHSHQYLNSSAITTTWGCTHRHSGCKPGHTHRASHPADDLGPAYDYRDD